MGVYGYRIETSKPDRLIPCKSVRKKYDVRDNGEVK